MQEPKHDQVRSRNEPFVARTATRIWYEEPAVDNPYIANKAFCYGYDLLELMGKRSFVEVFYLLFRGELPAKDEAQLLQQLMIALINPGPRHLAARAAMNTAVGKTDPVHILPIAAAVLGGEHEGAGEIEAAMRFLRKQQSAKPEDIANELLKAPRDGTSPFLCPGFGKHHGGIDLFTQRIAAALVDLPAADKALHWGNHFAGVLHSQGMGWLATGVAAAVFADLGFQPRAGACLYQLLCAPGLVAQGLELANKPITAMPFVSDENYVIER